MLTFLTSLLLIPSTWPQGSDDAALGAVIASMWGEHKIRWLIAGSGLREHIASEFTRTAGAASQIDYNVSGVAKLSLDVGARQPVRSIKIKNGNLM